MLYLYLIRYATASYTQWQTVAILQSVVIESSKQLLLWSIIAVEENIEYDSIRVILLKQIIITSQ